VQFIAELKNTYKEDEEVKSVQTRLERGRNLGSISPIFWPAFAPLFMLFILAFGVEQ
jgi:hypothetical protein